MKRFVNIKRIKSLPVTKLDHFAEYQLENYTKESSTFPSSIFGQMTRLRFGSQANQFMRECSFLVQLFISTATEKKDVQPNIYVYVKNFKLDEDVTYKHRSNYFICMSSRLFITAISLLNRVSAGFMQKVLDR